MVLLGYLQLGSLERSDKLPGTRCYQYPLIYSKLFQTYRPCHTEPLCIDQDLYGFPKKLPGIWLESDGICIYGHILICRDCIEAESASLFQSLLRENPTNVLPTSLRMVLEPTEFAGTTKTDRSWNKLVELLTEVERNKGLLKIHAVPHLTSMFRQKKTNRTGRHCQQLQMHHMS